MIRCAALLVVFLLSTGCELLISDSATRIAYAVRDGAADLRRSSNDTLTVSVPWRSWPDGCPGAYRVELLSDTDKFSGLGVECEPRGSHSTTYYRRFVKVPANLKVSHAKGEPTMLTLRKASNGTIEIVDLR